jgi:hypothetical protein
MLSSLVEQTAAQEILVDVAFMGGNGKPSTEEVISLFTPQLQIKPTMFSDYDEFQKRGLVRNRQLRECKTEWLLLADSDMVYQAEYFERLRKELLQNHSAATYMLSAGRLSASKFQTNLLINNSVNESAALISSAFQQVALLPNRSRRNCGAGYSQLINLAHAPHEGFYVEPKRNRDWSWGKRHQRARSDIQFRRRIRKLGGKRVSLPKWFSLNQIHLNHNRDRDFGCHIEEQR